MLRVSTIIRFLLFDKAAIRQIATSPAAVWPGLLFVLSAGFAREYDGEYLWAEPGHLLFPVAASLIGCLCMVLLVWMLARCRDVSDVSFLETFRSFLNLYWMTAPLAWLYAIPFERFLSPTDATIANLTLLGIVAVWRVALMVRSVQVLYDANWFAAMAPVVLFSDVLAMIALYWMPAPIVMIMGGVRLTESEDILLGFRNALALVVYGSFLLWLLFYFVSCARRDSWEWYRESDATGVFANSISSRVWLLAIASLLIWILPMFVTQPEQVLRYRAENMIRAGDYVTAAKLANDYPESAFPPHWDPPPRPAFGEFEPAVVDVFAGLVKENAPDWLLEHYDRKLRNESGRFRFYVTVLRYSDEQLEKYVRLVSEMDDNEEFMKRFRQMEGRLQSDEDLTDVRRALYKRMVEIGKEAER